MSGIKTIALAKVVGGGGGGGDTEIQALNVTQNGTYNPGSGKAYKPVTVNVPNSYAAADEGKVVDNGALVPQTSRNITTNDTYDTTTNNEVVVNVQPNLQSKTVTQNRTVTPDAGYDGLSSVVVNVSGGNDIIEEWDFTKSEVGEQKGISAVFNRITRDNNGALMNGVKGYILLSPVAQGFTVEIDVSTLGSASAKRFLGISQSNSQGLYYDSEWKFVTPDGTESTGLTDSTLFDSSTIKVQIDNDGKWHVYKNGQFLFSTNYALIPNYSVCIGTTTTGGIMGALITGAHIKN